MGISERLARPLDLGSASKRDVRTQFGALCWRLHNDKLQVLMVTTRRTRRWVIPKGWPMDNVTPGEAAGIEAFEEAGVEGVVRDTCIGIFFYAKEMEGDDLPCIVAVFPLKVKKTHAEWPEMNARSRRWMRPDKAARLVQEPELARLLLNFDPKRVMG